MTNATSPAFRQVIQGFRRLRGVGQVLVSLDSHGLLRPESIGLMESDPFGLGFLWQERYRIRRRAMRDLTHEVEMGLHHALHCAQGEMWQEVAEDCECSLAYVANYLFVYHDVTLEVNYETPWCIYDVVMGLLELVVIAKIRLRRYSCVEKYTFHAIRIGNGSDQRIMNCYDALMSF